MADFTITIPDQYIPRIKAALRGFFPEGTDPEGNPYPEPTNQEYLDQLTQFIRDYVKREIKDFELREAVRAAEESVTDIEVQ